MITMTQKNAMKGCMEAAQGDKNRAICMYATLEESGLVPRESNVTPRDAKNYACILWHTGKKLGWYNE